MSELEPRIVTLDNKDIVVRTRSLKHELQIEQAEAMYEALNRVIKLLSEPRPDAADFADSVEREAREILERINND